MIVQFLEFKVIKIYWVFLILIIIQIYDQTLFYYSHRSYNQVNEYTVPICKAFLIRRVLHHGSWLMSSKNTLVVELYSH